MADEKSKKIAAITAVNAYLQDEEAALAAESALTRASAFTGPALWALAGRQEIMTMRRLIQMKAFQRKAF